MDGVSRRTRALQVLLNTRKTELRRIIYKAPARVPSQIKKIQSVYSKVSTRTVKKCKITDIK